MDTRVTHSTEGPSSTRTHGNEEATALARARYDRQALRYDRRQGMLEGMQRPWRRRLWARSPGRAC